jgi:hypothetical protein
VKRLEREGWLEHFSPKLPDGTNDLTIFSAGRMLKRLLVMLTKSQHRKSPTNKPAKSTWHFSLIEEQKLLSLLDKEKTPPTADTLGKIPLLKRWLERGKE